MKTCPVCREQFEDELRFCTFDGAPLPGGPKGASGALRNQHLDEEPTAVYGGSHRREGSGWKWAFFVLLMLVLAGGGIGAAYMVKNRQNRAPAITASPVVVTEARQTAATPISDEAVDKPPSLAALSRQELMDRLPQNLLRRFHSGDPGQGLPDDLRIVAAPKGECVVLLGSGRLEGGPRTLVERILILKFEEDEFKDMTRQLLPAAYGSGTITGRGAQVKFAETGTNILVRGTASSNSVVKECATCDHAYQVVTLEWKNGRYVESARTWENDRYTVFYLVAEALEKKKVDSRARPFIETSLDPIIAQGFPRNGNEGWTVEFHGEEGAETAAYELGNNFDRLSITVAMVKGQWKAVQMVE
ncbi:MAG TPA: hypothetical protein VGV87_23370 [Blastocatellia bacterium]|jgi:hypothetical protein|nr:hypothetical protein [Blastocatellia bacterium]